MKAEDVQPMAQPDAMHKAMINLAGLGMIMIQSRASRCVDRGTN